MSVCLLLLVYSCRCIFPPTCTGQSAPRAKNCDGNPLPSARAISNCVHKAGSKMKFHDRYSGMIAQMGQFFAHDVALTGMSSRK